MPINIKEAIVETLKEEPVINKIIVQIETLEKAESERIEAEIKEKQRIRLENERLKLEKERQINDSFKLLLGKITQ